MNTHIKKMIEGNDRVSTVMSDEALIESEQRYRALVEMSMEAIVIHAGKTVLYVNPSAVKMFGAASEADLVGRPILEFVHPDDREIVLARVKRAVETGVSAGRAELRYRKFDGTIIVAEVRGTSIKYEGKPALQISMRDVTERKNTEKILSEQYAALSTLNHFSIELSNLTPEMELEALITKWIKEVSGAEMALYSEYNPETRSLAPLHIEVDPGHLEKGINLLGRQWKNIRSVVNDEMYREMTRDIIGTRNTLHEVSFGAIPRPVGAAIQALFRVDRFIGVAYLIEGYLYGTSVLGMSKDHPDPPRHILENFVHLAASSLRRKKMEQKLRESEERFRSLYENSAIGLYRTTPGGEVFLANPTLVKMLGYASFEELAAKKLDGKDFQPSYDRKFFLEQIETVGEIQNLESIWTRKDGTILHVSESARAFRDAHGKTLYYDGTVEDITERKKMLNLLHDTEARQGAMIANIADALAIIAEDGTIRYHSDNSEKIFGWKSTDLIGRLFHEIAHPDDKERLLKALALFMKKGNASATIEFRFMAKDGGYRLVELTAANLINDQSINGVLVNYHDITERKAAEYALRESDDRLRRAEEVAMTGNWKMSLAEEMMHVSDGAKKIYGFDLNTVSLPEAQSFVLPEYRALLNAALRELIEHDLPYEVEFKIRNKVNGNVIAIHSKAEYDRSSRTVFGVIQDVTERKRLEQQLIQAQKMEGVGTLAGGIAHDFNNLLAMILGSAELLRHHSEENPELVKYVDRIIDASERGSSISRQLLIFSRPDQVELKPISLSQVISDIRVLLKHFLPKTMAIETAMEIDHGIIMGDAGQIHQALLNLALNARDAMSDSGTLTIREFTVTPEAILKKFGHERSGPFVGLSVSDTGSGMDDVVVGKIFDPFFSTKEKGKGTGLGLSMVHAIVRNHEGYIDVETAPGRGTTIFLYFPAVSHTEIGEHAVVSESAVPHAGTILVVDDEDPLREMLAEYLDTKGYHVYTAANGTEALQSFEQHGGHIDLIITDLGMPDMRGEELYRRLRKIHGDIKVIVSSGYLDGTTKEHLLHMGVKGVLTKPYRLSAIGDEIQKILSA